MSGKALMLQGTGSDVGKTTLVAGLCRIARRRGLKVAPFKPQNMSNNAAVTPDGGEIGRAQALQALACGLAPHTDFNPVLLKPQSDRSAQIIVQGQVSQTLMAADFMARRQALLPAVLESFTRLIQAYDLVLVEGAGSVAETNLRARDIANMGFARAAGVPVVLVGDIDRGGVIASLVGSQVVLEADDAAQIIGFLVNRFRGDPTLFDEGRAEIIRHTGWRDFGLMPWLPAAARLPAEDAVTVLSQTGSGCRQVKIVVPMLSRLANFDDLDPLRAEPAVEVRFVPPGQPLPLDADLILLAGTKSTRADLDFFRDQGWDIDLAAHVRRGGRVLGLCGGYQMLGRTVADPHGVDGSPGCSQGLGYLQVDTLMDPSKVMRVVQGRSLTLSGPVEAYEIHMGQTRGPDCARPLFDLGDRQDGAVDASGRVSGTYLHGLFSSDPFRRAWLEDLSTGAGSDLQHGRSVEAALDRLADLMEPELDIDGLLQAARPAGWLP